MSDDFRLGIQIPEPDINESGEFFAALADPTCNALVAAGIPAETAAEAVNRVLVHLAETFSGEKFYVTKQPATFARWMMAYQDLRRMPSRDVDRKYGWSDGYSLRVKEKVDALIQRRTQLRLPLNSKK